MSRSRNIQTQQLRDQFIDFTSTTAPIADHYLKGANYDLEVAINTYYRHSQTSANTRDNKPLNNIFNQYKDSTNPEIIGIDGTIKYIEDLGYQPEDKVVLALAEFLESPSVGVFERKKFILKWESAKVENIKTMKSYMKYLDVRLKTDQEYLKTVYQFTYAFVLDEGKKLLLDYWRLLLSEQYGDKLELWVAFLEKEGKKSVSKDVWNMFYLFLQDFVKDPQLENYDETAAWPSLIDEFVEDFKGI
ncbi:hypothetical protein WICPIJ_001720 [Wickerhamomyces pijperi]|uniref:Defective in cullin neddylation protein n=1 Tax=Wickerhamomyces pijperi TaxID=599730 RepID=A0A9P8QCZ6_WICPI|nr:hypothetical protein WICPIJ_001720 [Wickerhamomyces pijperi]